MHAYPFLRVTSVVACNCHVPNWNINFYLLTIVSICIMEEINLELNTCFMVSLISECVSLICGFLIYVGALLFPRFPKLMVANLKVKKNLQKIMLSSNRQIFSEKFL